MFWLVLLISISTGCSLVRAGMAYFQSMENFKELDPGSGLFYEEGAKYLALVTKKHITEAVVTVEQKQYKPFKEKVTVYICTSKESFSKYSGASKKVRGAAFNKKVFISPRAVVTKTLNLILIHELSHLHFQQHIGVRRNATNIPPWFQEGLAVYVSGGGGAEKITDAAARKSIINGNSLEPNDSGSIFFPRTAFSFGLKPQMFYRQSAMFVEFLSKNNQHVFKEFVTMLLDDTEFKVAFKKTFGQSIDSVWVDFVEALKTQRAI